MCGGGIFWALKCSSFSILYGVYTCFSLVFRSVAVVRNDVAYVTLVNSVAPEKVIIMLAPKKL